MSNNNQGTIAKIQRHVIDPLHGLFGATINEHLLDAYVEELGNYSEQTLDLAIKHIRRESKRTPTLANIIDAVYTVLNKQRRANAGSNSGKPFVNEIREKQRELVSEYCKKFKNYSTIYAEARRENWDLDLMKYVEAIADVQAQFIERNANGHIGWNGFVIFGAGNIITDEMKHVFFDGCKAQAERGSIEVGIPTGMIAHWKGMASYRERMAEQLERRAAKAPQTQKTAIDDYLDKHIAAKIEQKPIIEQRNEGTRYDDL